MQEIVDGRAIAQDIQARVRAEVDACDPAPELHIVLAGEHPVTENFIAIKRRFAERVGVPFVEHRFASDISAEELRSAIAELCAAPARGVVVQLPLPPGLASHTQTLLDAVAPDCDPDMLSTASRERFKAGTSPINPPVVGALAEIATRYGVALSGARAVVVGEGRLVGAPVREWLAREGAQVSSVNADTEDIRAALVGADIVVSGAGHAGLITEDMIPSGAAVFDAGTSEAGGRVRGDVAPEAAGHARLLTPVPGGIGPVTVAKLFENLVTLACSKSA